MTMKHFATLILVAILTLPAICIAQKTVSVSDTNKGANSWMPVKLGSDGGNVYNNVSFYKKQSICNSDTVILLKAVNTNTYPVKIMWTLDDVTVSSVIIQATSTLEGSCDASKTTEDAAKLIFQKSEINKSGFDKKKWISTLVVTKF